MNCIPEDDRLSNKASYAMSEQYATFPYSSLENVSQPLNCRVFETIVISTLPFKAKKL